MVNKPSPKERKRLYDLRYRLENSEKVKAKKKAWYQKNRASIIAKVTRNTAANWPERYAYLKAYWAKNAEKRRSWQLAAKANRRAREMGNGGSHTAEEVREKFEAMGNACVYCGDSSSPMSVDHAIPLARGGSNGIENIVPACLPCNKRKNNRTAEEFMAWLMGPQGLRWLACRPGNAGLATTAATASSSGNPIGPSTAPSSAADAPI